MSISKINEPSSISIALWDLNGVARGKRLPGEQLDKALQGKVRMPLSATTVDIWGRDIEGSKLVFASGDADGVCQPIRDQLLPTPWLGPATGMVPVCMYTENGEPSSVDPRHVLAKILQRFSQHKLTPVVATELEFYLTPLGTNREAFKTDGVLSLHELDSIAPLLDDIYYTCALQGIAADAAISECGPGQFEINLQHRDNALLAADDAIFFKHIVKGFARKHGFTASFMAKTFGPSAGSGLHLHVSVLDEERQNVFNDGTDEGSEVLHSAVAGVLDTMVESALIFAPHYNSYRRLRPNTHAPTSVCWGYENRTAAVRIPGGSPAARRFEHRVAGADANPYLVMAIILGAALTGIENRLAPAPPIIGNAYEASLPQLPDQWSAAISAFEAGSTIRKLFPEQLIEVFVQLKRQEQMRFLEQISSFEHESYVDQI